LLPVNIENYMPGSHTRWVTSPWQHHPWKTHSLKNPIPCHTILYHSQSRFPCNFFTLWLFSHSLRELCGWWRHWMARGRGTAPCAISPAWVLPSPRDPKSISFSPRLFFVAVVSGPNKSRIFYKFVVIMLTFPTSLSTCGRDGDGQKALL